MVSKWPKRLSDAAGPIRSDKLDGAALGMGEWGDETRAAGPTTVWCRRT